MLQEIVGKWWLIVLKGFVAVSFGMLAISWPGKTLAFFALLFGLYLLIEGVLTVLLALINHKKLERVWTIIFQGILAIIVGLIIFSWPGITVAALYFIFALWMMITGIIVIVQAILHRHDVPGEWLLIASGLIMLMFGMLLINNPQISVAIVGILFGLSLLFNGVMTIAFGFQVRSTDKRILKALKA